MPEMLEVELYRRDVEPLRGSTIHQVDAPDAHWVRHAPDVADAVTGRRLLAARRHGKVLLLDTDGPTVALRFGMTGRLLVDGRSGVGSLVYGAHGPDPAWRRLTLSIGDSDVVVSDPRRLGWVELDPPLDDLGPDVGDAHGDELATVLTQRCGSSRVAVKAALLDQSRVAGLGNMLADEVLLRAGDLAAATVPQPGGVRVVSARIGDRPGPACSPGGGWESQRPVVVGVAGRGAAVPARRDTAHTNGHRGPIGVPLFCASTVTRAMMDTCICGRDTSLRRATSR